MGTQTLNLDYHGKVDLYLRDINSQSLLQEVHQPNLFLLSGRKQLIHQIYQGSTYNIYILLSSSTRTPVITDTCIGGDSSPVGVYTYSSSNPSAQYASAGLTLTVRYYYSFPAPSAGQTRSINCVGLASITSGTYAYCYTKLTDTVTQTDSMILDVYYSLTISPY